jgi:uncharacterized membrane protein YgaE (UPF0421/DUF939 family)
MDQIKYIYENLDQFVASKLTPEQDDELDKELNKLKNDIDNKNKLFDEKRRENSLKMNQLKKINNVEEIKNLETLCFYELKLNKLENLDYDKNVQDKINDLRNKLFKDETGFTLKEYIKIYNSK